jgi:ABC-type uncharacterized transport system involved in gliding motility auxiliary subunit
MQFAIDQYALRGGHIVAFVDPMAEADQSGADPQNPLAAMTANKSSQLDPLLTAWGVKFNPREVIGDRGRALSVSTRQGAAPVMHLGILGLDRNSMAAGDVITAGLSDVNVETAGYLEPVPGSGVKFEPLLQSSTEAAPIPVQKFSALFDPATLMDGFKPTGKRYTLAARVSGNVKTAFPAGPPKGVTLPAGQSALQKSASPLHLVVFADTDMLSDFLWVHEQNFFGQRLAQAFASNNDLLMNTLDNLAGSTDLISVRGRATYTRPFERVEALRHNADERFHAKEQELQAQLHDAEDKLTALQTKRNDKSSVILTPEQEKELDHFQQEKLRIRKELRAVQAGLNEDINRLGMELKILNIVIVPLVFACAALLLGLSRRRRRQERAAARSGTTAGTPAASNSAALNNEARS